jgi:3-methyladenine DNA glycosylase AlkD
MSALPKVLAELEQFGSPSIKKVLLNHGAREPLFGVKVEDLKKIVKRVKADHALALELYDTGIYDAMYLAGLVADPAKMTKARLNKWANGAYAYGISQYTVAGVAAESRYGSELARAWIDSPKELVASAGWSTWGLLLAIKPDAELDRAEIEKLLGRVREQIHAAPNRVRYTMIGFVIAVGCYVPALAAKAKGVARAVGTVEVDMGETACRVPDAVAYIEKVERMGRQGKKRTSARC